MKSGLLQYIHSSVSLCDVFVDIPHITWKVTRWPYGYYTSATTVSSSRGHFVISQSLYQGEDPALFIISTCWAEGMVVLNVPCVISGCLCSQDLHVSSGSWQAHTQWLVGQLSDTGELCIRRTAGVSSELCTKRVKADTPGLIASTFCHCQQLF